MAGYRTSLQLRSNEIFPDWTRENFIYQSKQGSSRTCKGQISPGTGFDYPMSREVGALPRAAPEAEACVPCGLINV